MSLYFVNGTTGKDSNNGQSVDSPWRTIAKANATLGAGDTVRIMAGEYNERIEPVNSGQEGKRIIYTNFEDDEVTLLGQPGEENIVILANKGYITVKDLNISYQHQDAPRDSRGRVRFPWIIISGENAVHNVIKRCKLVIAGPTDRQAILQRYADKYQEWGIILSGCRHCVVKDCHIEGVNQGIQLKNRAKYNLIKNNTIRNTALSCIVFATSKSEIQANLVINNLLENSVIEDGIQFMPDPEAADTTTDLSNRGALIFNNIIRNNAENAIDLKGARNVVIHGNIIYGSVGSNNGWLDGGNRNAMAGISRGSRTICRDVIIRHNVLYDNSNGARLHPGFKIYK